MSIVMPVCNAERYVGEAVASILSQSFRDWEFLIFDDGSSDSSLNILERYASQDRRIKLFTRQHKGYVAWLNEGLEQAHGQFIARMDADDISLHERLARQVEHFRRHPDCVAVGCNLLMIDSDGEPLGEVFYDTDHETIKTHLLKGTLDVICHPASMIKRSALLAIGGYRKEYESVEDFAIWLGLIEQGKLANIPEVLFKYRKHHTSVSATKFERQKQLANQIITQERLRRGLKPITIGIQQEYMPPRSITERHLEWAMIAAASGYRITALKHAFIGIRTNPELMTAWFVLIRCLIPNKVLSLFKPLLLPIRPKWNRGFVHK